MMIFLPFALAALCAWFLVRPHVATTYAGDRDSTGEVENIEEQKDRCVQVLKDLELDFQTQKISAADYQQMRDSISLELAALIEKLDRHV